MIYGIAAGSASKSQTYYYAILNFKKGYADI